VDDDFYISFNMPARHLSQMDVSTYIAACLAGHQLNPNHLRLEITESSILDNDIAIRTMQQLKAQGIHLSVDDFGTGYSSLSYLHKLPVNTLKIDRAFIQNMNRNQKDTSVVSAILGIAKALKLDVVAEGIDQPNQVDQLRQMNCQFGQGYLFARPLPAVDIQALLADNCGGSQACKTRRYYPSKQVKTLALRKTLYSSNYCF
jgi:EAL domain-containing protein (putative c-di-GMP-specific phosphodiesterase class I)